MPVADPDVADAVLEDAGPAVALDLADLEHPWLGLESFREETRAYFFGRDTEIAELQLRLRSHPLLVLYGRSGLGKTSILMAGLIPRLRAEERRPLLVRLRYEDPASDVCGQLVSAVFGWGDGQGGPVRLKPRPTKSLLWTRRLAEKLNLPLPDDLPSRLWLRLHNRAEPTDITHLILDQFEEVFTLGARRAGGEDEVRDTLAILLQGTIPDPISRLIAEHDSFLDHFDPDSVPVRVILALRDDYVYALNRWRRHLPALGRTISSCAPCAVRRPLTPSLSPVSCAATTVSKSAKKTKRTPGCRRSSAQRPRSALFASSPRKAKKFQLKRSKPSRRFSRSFAES